MGVESSTVNISIEVVDANSAQAVGAVTQNLNALGAAGATSGAKVAAGMAAAESATKSFAQQSAAALDAYMARIRAQQADPGYQQRMQQMKNEMNARIAAHVAEQTALTEAANAANAAAGAGRSMAGTYGEARIAMGALVGNARAMDMGLAAVGARTKWLAPLWEAAMPIAVGVAAIGIIVQMGEEVYNLYEKWIDVDGAIERYNDKASEAASKKFFENAGIDELSADLQMVNSQLDQLTQKRTQSGKAILGGTPSAADMMMAPSMGAGPEHPLFTMHDANQLNEAQGKADADRERMLEETHKTNLQLIQDKALITEATLTGIAKERAARDAAGREADETRRFRIAQQSLAHEITSRPTDKKPGDAGYVTPVAAPGANAYQSEDTLARQHADAEYQAHSIETARQTAEEMQRLHEQAEEAELQASRSTQKGYEQLELQRKTADAEFVRAHGQNAQALADIDQKYYAEEKKLAEQQVQQHQAAERQLQQVQMETRLASLTGVARTQQEGQDKVNSFLNEDHPGMDPGQRLAQVHAMVQQTTAAVAQEQQAFADHVNGIVAATADRAVSGFARIHADAEKEIQALQQEAAEKGGDPRVEQRGEMAIRQQEAAEVTARNQQNAAETSAIEDEARAKMLGAEKNQTAAIVSEYEQRTEKFKEELDKGLISHDDYNRRMLAAQQIEEAQEIESARAAREKMAGEYTSFFRSLDHPLQALQEMGDKVAGQAAAAMTQRIQQHYGGHGAAGGGNSLDDIFNKMGGTPAPPRGGAAGVSGGGGHTIALASAEIHIQNASIGFGGVPAGAGGSRPTYTGGGFSGGDFNGAGAGGYGFSSAGSTVGGGGAYVGDSGSSSSAAPSSYAPGMGSAGMAPVARNTAGLAVGNAQQGLGLYKQAAGIFSNRGSSEGSGTTAGASSSDTIPLEQTQNFDVGQLAKNPDGSMASNGMTTSNTLSAAQGAIGVYGAYEGNGGVGGALSGAMSGMQLGMAVGGPLGAAIGAAAGAAIGAIGMGGREKARVYDLKTVRPTIADTEQSYETGATDYLSAYSAMQSLDMQASKTIRAYGPAAESYYNDTIKAEIQQAEAKFGSMEKAGRSNFTASAASYAVGTDYIPSTSYNLNHEGERIIPSDQNERITRAIESGSDGSRMPAAQAASWSGDLHVHAIDAKGVAQFLSDNKHGIRAALTQSYAENSGGADAGF